MRDIGRYGEIEVYRRQIAATGKPVAELAAEGRRRRAEDDARAAQTAAAASRPLARARLRARLRARTSRFVSARSHLPAQVATTPKYFFSITGVIEIFAATKLAVKHTSAGLPGLISRVM